MPSAASRSPKMTTNTISRDEDMTDDATVLVPETQLETNTMSVGIVARSDCSTSTKRPDSPLFVSDGDVHSPKSTTSHTVQKQGRFKDSIIIVIPPVTRRWEYRLYDEDSVLKEILDEYEDSDGLQYWVRFRSGREVEVSSTWNF